jgi:tRNA dimethylallyltransferase
VSCDAIQVYRGLETLSGAATPQERSRLEHRLVGFVEVRGEFSAGQFATLAHAEIDQLLTEGRRPIVVGGTGLYLRAALADLEVPPAPPTGARARFEALYDELGPNEAHALLAERDPEAATAVHANDRRRVVRALELAEAGGSLKPREDRLFSTEARHPSLVVGLDVPSEELRSRIERRTQTMIERGVVEEVRAALTAGVSPTAAKTLGLAEVAQLPPDDAMAAIVRRTARYAAYQRKWLRRLPGVVSLSATRPAGVIADEILEVARSRQRLPAGRAG